MAYFFPHKTGLSDLLLAALSLTESDITKRKLTEIKKAERENKGRGETGDNARLVVYWN